MLCDLISTCDTQVYATLANECGDVCSREKDDSYFMVLDEGNIEARFTAEFYVGAGEKVEGYLVKTALW